MNQIIKRIQSPTPKFFRRLRTIGIVLAAVGGTLLTAPISLPVVVVTIGGYLITAGSILTAVAQATTEADDLPLVIQNPE